MNLDIKYDNGSMTVYLENFLSMRSVPRVKKLLKIIRYSYTPEAEDKLMEFVRFKKDEADLLILQAKADIKQYEDKVTQCEMLVRQITPDVAWAKNKILEAKKERDSHRKKTKIWKDCDENLKEKRKALKVFTDELKRHKYSLKMAKRQLQCSQSSLKNHTKDREFYQKVLRMVE